MNNLFQFLMQKNLWSCYVIYSIDVMHVMTIAYKKVSLAILAVLAAIWPTCASADTNIFDEVVIQGSLGIGSDATTNKLSATNDVFLLSENNVRINFVDPSNNNWRIQINDSSNGGAEYFAIVDDDTGRTIFRVDAGAPDGAFRISSSGTWTFGGGGLLVATDTLFINTGSPTNSAVPAQQVHLIASDSPTVRLEPDDIPDVAEQFWELIGNEVNFVFPFDRTTGSTVFAVQHNAPTNSLVIRNPNGFIGMGTATPLANLHVLRTNGTAKLLIRENQAGPIERELLELRNTGAVSLLLNNEATTNTVTLASHTNDTFQLTLEDMESAYALSIGTNQTFGIGTDTPETSLHVVGTNGTTSVVIDDIISLGVTRNLLELRNQGSVLITVTNSDTATAWELGSRDTSEFIASVLGTSGDEFVIQPNGQVEIGPGNQTVCTITPAGALQIQGVFAQGSDRTRKENIQKVDPKDILDQVASLPIAFWTFKDDLSNESHVGPMAQDFHTTFAVGTEEVSLAPLDALGVALASIQGMHNMTEATDQELAALERQTDSIQTSVQEIRAQLNMDE